MTDGPEWLPEDRDAAIVWQTEQRRKCKRCGTSPWEFEDDPDAWVADHEDCEGCRRLDIEQDSVRKSPGLHMGTRTILMRPDHGS